MARAKAAGRAAAGSSQGQRGVAAGVEGRGSVEVVDLSGEPAVEQQPSSCRPPMAEQQALAGPLKQQMRAPGLQQVPPPRLPPGLHVAGAGRSLHNKQGLGADQQQQRGERPAPLPSVVPPASVSNQPVQQQQQQQQRQGARQLATQPQQQRDQVEQQQPLVLPGLPLPPSRPHLCAGPGP
jgi:hypothetical protein